jgi:uncharacterized protein (TIGR03437 family)
MSTIRGRHVEVSFSAESGGVGRLAEWPVATIAVPVRLGLTERGRTRIGVGATFIDVPVADRAPGLYTADASGRGAVRAWNADLSLNGPGSPAGRGTVLTLAANGLGREPVRVLIGGVVAEVLGVESAGGEWRVSVRVPMEVRSGAVPVVLTGGGASTQEGVTVEVR